MAVLVLAAAFAVTGSGQAIAARPDQDTARSQPYPDKSVTVTAPARTARASVTVRGKVPAEGRVRVAGGIVPVTVITDRKGAFAAEVPLRPNADTRLKVSAAWGTRAATTRLTVRQRLVKPVGKVSGRVVDTAGKPVAGATVRYGKRTATTTRAGRYTLTQLPTGRVAISVRSRGRLSGLTFARIGAGPARVDKAVLRPLAAPRRLTPAGGVFKGPGWRVEVPAGAVTVRTNLNVTPLTMTGPMDAFGAPLVDLSPSGLRFARPITVRVNPGVLGLTPRQVNVVLVNPDGPSATTKKARVVGDELVFTLTELNGVEIRLEDFVAIWGGLAAWCTPFASTVAAEGAREYLRAVLPPYLLARIGQVSEAMWRSYLGGGEPDGSVTPITDPSALEEFGTVFDARAAQDALITEVADRLRAAPPALTDPAAPATVPLTTFPGLGQDVRLDYLGPHTTPGNVAGRVGHAEMLGVVVPDRRDFTGDVKVVQTITDAGVRTKVELVPDLTLRVQDALDFCPDGAGDPGLGIEQNATLPLSRLEVTPQLTSGFYARKYMFSATTKAKPRAKDVTAWYPGNDPDGDGAPDTAPYPGWTRSLDNCPGVANPDQSDVDSDGIGTACDSTEEPPDGGTELPPGGVPSGPDDPVDGETVEDAAPADPGPGGSYGDPHFVTFDGGLLDFHAVGDYVIAKSTTDQFEVQGRYTRLSPELKTVTFNRGVAARVGSSVIAFGDDSTSLRRGSLVAALDGQPLALTPGRRDLPGGATLTVSEKRGAVVRWPDGTELAAGRWTGDNAFLTLAPARWGKVHGLLGNADRDPANDTATANGTVVRNVTAPEQLYGVLGASWRRTGAASFFRSAIPADGALPVVPPTIASPADLTPQARTEADRICRERGLLPGRGLDQCVLDVGLSGDARFADDAAVVANRLGTTVDLAALGGPVEDTRTISLGERVSGSLSARYAADVYAIDLQAGGTARITLPGSCTDSFVATLVAPSGRVLGRNRGPGCGALGLTKLKESGRYHVRVFDTGGFTGGYELQVDGDGLGLTCQATEVAPTDDGSGPEVQLPFPVDFKGRTFNSLWVNNNGNVTFDGPSSLFTPQPMSDMGRAMVAAWLGDVDTRGEGSKPVRYGSGSVGGRRAFCVDYDGVGYYNSHADKLNSFQLFVVDRGDVAAGAVDLVFRYRSLRWETGDESGGTGGLGGSSAGVGYTNGTGQAGTFLELPGSRTPGALLDSSPTGLARTSTNSDEAGLHILPIR